MRVLVSGAGGFLGRYVVDRLVERGHWVRAIIRPAAQEPTWTGNVQTFRADLRVSDNLVSAFDGIEAVIHLAAGAGTEDQQFASTVVGTERFLNAMARSSTKRLVHISSLVVYDWHRVNNTLDEDGPLLSDIYAMSPYTIAKAWQERLVSRSVSVNSFDITIMRPGFIWGHRHAEISGMGRHYGSIYLLFGPFTRLPLCHVANCADCIVAAAESPAAIGKTFNVIDCDEVRVWHYVRQYSRLTGKGGFLLPIPYRIGLGLAHLASFASHILIGSNARIPSLLMPRRFESQFKPIRFSTRRVQNILGWHPPLSFDQCLALTYPDQSNLATISEPNNRDLGAG